MNIEELKKKRIIDLTAEEFCAVLNAQEKRKVKTNVMLLAQKGFHQSSCDWWKGIFSKI